MIAQNERIYKCRTKASQIIHGSYRVLPRTLCGAFPAEQLHEEVAPEEIDCINCRKIAVRNAGRVLNEPKTEGAL